MIITPLTSPTTDDAPAHEVLQELTRCAGAWDPDVRIIGNIRACDIIRSINEVLRTPPEPQMSG